MKLRFSQKVTLVVIVVVLVGFGGYGFVNDRIQQRSIETNLHNTVQQIAQVTAMNIHEWMTARAQLIRSAQEGVQGRPSREGITEIISRQVMLDTFGMTYVGLSDSADFINSPPKKMPDGYDYRSRPRYKQAVAANGMILSDPYVDSATQKLVVSMATPVRAQNNLVGVLGVDVALTSVVSTLNTQNFGGLGFPFIVNAEGKILISPDEATQLKSMTDVYGQTINVSEPKFWPVISNGVEKILYFTPIEGLPGQSWYLGVNIDRAKAFASLQEMRITALVATLLTVVGVSLLLLVIIRILTEPLRVMGEAMRDIAIGEGDLTRRLTISSEDEFGSLARDFNSFITKIHNSLISVRSVAGGLNEISGQVVQATESTLENAGEQSSRTTNVAAAIHELGAAAAEIATNASQASREASWAKEASLQGQLLVEESSASMLTLSSNLAQSQQNIFALNDQTASIGKILDVIKAVSEQTNLLALNAAIEAARAGEAGRGFAVVADEVRGLAHRTQKSTEEINTVIAGLEAQSQVAVVGMRESKRLGDASVTVIASTGQQLSMVLLKIKDIDGMNMSVAAATEEQTNVVGAIGEDMAHIETLTRACVENLQLTKASCVRLDAQALELQGMLSKFRL
ncbi:methyl-accepting chemotaxis protein [Pseudomonas protegens]